jgi:hypothetical protein
MWIDSLKQKIKQLHIRYEDAAESMDMTLNGFNSAIKAGSFRFENIMKFAEKYDFSLDELRFGFNNDKIEKAIDKYKNTVNKIQISHCENTIPKDIYEDIKKNYENRIIDLQSQIKFMQHLLEKQQSCLESKSS